MQSLYMLIDSIKIFEKMRRRHRGHTVGGSIEVSQCYTYLFLISRRERHHVTCVSQRSAFHTVAPCCYKQPQWKRPISPKFIFIYNNTRHTTTRGTQYLSIIIIEITVIIIIIIIIATYQSTVSQSCTLHITDHISIHSLGVFILLCYGICTI